ncbi:hypothetical protein LMG27177_04306 [Paraburkholderia fynbosensis]|uniref:Uncharacterized protein n=1 Tax=Paraburkholderia fynbosensis TaxID=1200993 RepID=A0A6J5GIN5_9BURK|nr:hypothetical protein LMG27177_04306 [Paraburkholderia fynbosensis]
MDAPGSTTAGRGRAVADVCPPDQSVTWTAVPLHKQPQEGRRHERPVRVGCGPSQRAVPDRCEAAGTCYYLPRRGRGPALAAAHTTSAVRDTSGGVCALSCIEWVLPHCQRRWQYLVNMAGGIPVGGMSCRLTSTGARSAVKSSNMPSILLNIKPLIRLVRSAETRRFSTYPRHLSQERPERVEICLTG